MAILKNISKNNLTDAELVELYQVNQQQEILAELYLRYSDLVYGTCVKYLKDLEIAKDAVIDIYQELVEKLKTHNVDSFKSWLYVLAKNHCLMKLRRDKKMPTTELQPGVMQSEDFSHLDGVLEKEQQLDQLGACLEQLQVEQRNSVRLFYLENKCYNEISDITGYEWNKVRSLIQNGKRNLKNCMETNGK
jgi:RNA polymerase sigma-70 factor (ECF subfamily)